MDIDKLRVFCLVSDHNSYVEAANITGISRSGIGKMISALEKDLGVNLIFVKGKRILPTKEGLIFYQRAKGIIENFDRALKGYMKDIAVQENKLVINTTLSYASTWLPSLIGDFHKKTPLYQYEIFGSDNTPSFADEKIDVAIRPYIHDQENLIQKPLNTFDMVLHASEEYISKHGEPKTIADLKDHQIIAFNAQKEATFDFFNWHLKHLPKSFNPFIYLNSGMGIMKLVEKGLGIGAVSREGARISPKKLVPVLKDLKAPCVDIYYIYQGQQQVPEKIVAFYEFLTSTLSR